ncbi:hypothetical protein GCM10025870_22840 [Agromyces marinus]|uniref:Uncharacterized protein n=1 Tax=Agromyces marinus TaxID=1389020 RepID=A0ABM8H338_9MICO|nr:hypothetical protein GCM10025870_22840 [Agromyces marinus]
MVERGCDRRRCLLPDEERAARGVAEAERFSEFGIYEQTCRAVAEIEQARHPLRGVVVRRRKVWQQGEPQGRTRAGGSGSVDTVDLCERVACLTVDVVGRVDAEHRRAGVAERDGIRRDIHDPTAGHTAEADRDGEERERGHQSVARSGPEVVGGFPPHLTQPHARTSSFRSGRLGARRALP